MDWEACSDGYVPNSSRNPLPPSATTGLLKGGSGEFLEWGTGWSSQGTQFFRHHTRKKVKQEERGDFGAKGGKENKVEKFIGLGG